MDSSPKMMSTAASIRNITGLREALDYGDPTLPRSRAFYDDIRVFRKKYRTISGLDGADLHDWTSKEHQAALSEMTTAYLDKEGNGNLFWPDDEASSKHNKLQYSKDCLKIKRLVKQLFFRLNQQQYRNIKYKKKAKEEASNAERAGRSTEDAIMVDTPHPSDTSREGPFLTHGSQASPPAGEASLRDSLIDASINTLSNSRVDPPRREDVYDLPQSPQPYANMDAKPVSLAPPGALSKKHKLPIDPALMANASKPKKKKSTARRTPKKKAADDTVKWTSPRNKSAPHRASYVVGSEYNEVMDTVATKAQRARNGIEETPTTQPEESLNHSVEDDSTAEIFSRPQQISTISETRDERPDNSTSISPAAAFKAPIAPMDWAQFSSSSVALLPTPAPTNEGSDKPSRQASEQLDKPEPRAVSTTPTPGTKPTPSPQAQRVEFVWHILTRMPLLEYRSWNPRGKFLDKSLSDLMEELAPGPEAKGLILRLEGPGLRIVEEILRGDDSRLESMKRVMTRFIRSWLIDPSNAGAKLHFDFEIEPMMGDSKAVDAEAGEVVVEF